MPRYFFHSRDGVAYRDPNGLELPDMDAAGLEAMRYLAEIIRDDAAEVWRAGDLQLTIADEHGAELCVFSVTRRDAVPPG